MERRSQTCFSLAKWADLTMFGIIVELKSNTEILFLEKEYKIRQRKKFENGLQNHNTNKNTFASKLHPETPSFSKEIKLV